MYLFLPFTSNITVVKLICIIRYKHYVAPVGLSLILLIYKLRTLRNEEKVHSKETNSGCIENILKNIIKETDR